MIIDELHMRSVLRHHCEISGGQKAWAATHGFSKKYVNDAFNGKVAITGRMAQCLGYNRFIAFYDCNDQ
jgi:DNA-binding transcriptional regulator YdaS (Cro superfamily)